MLAQSNEFYKRLLTQIEDDPDRFVSDPNLVSKIDSSPKLSNEERDALYLKAVILNKSSINYVPEAKRTYTMYLEAVKQDPELMEIVPKSMQDYQMFFECVSRQDNNSESALSIAKIPLEMRDFKMCAAIIQRHALALKDIKDYETSTTLNADEYEKLCDIGLESNPLSIQFIRESLWNETRFNKAIQKDCRVIKFLTANIMVDEHIHEAAVQQFKNNIKKDLALLQYAPDYLLDDNDVIDLAKLLIREHIEKRQNIFAFQVLPSKFKTKNVWLMMVPVMDNLLELLKNPQNRIAVSDNDYREICLAVVSGKYGNLNDVPEQFRDEEMCLAAVKSDWQALQYISPHLKNYEEICIEAVKKNPQALQYVSKDNQNYEQICFEAVKFFWQALEFVPTNLKNYETIVTEASNTVLRSIDLDKPTVVMLYVYTDGIVYADKFIEYLNKATEGKLNFIFVTPTNALLLPLLQDNHIDKIDGLVIPGGPNVDFTKQRAKTEIALLEFAIKNKIPTLGICRGHQVIGHYFGGEIKPMNHEHAAGIVVVKSKIQKGEKPESRLYTRLKEKHQKFEENKIKTHSLSKNENNAFSYETSCVHSQAVFFKKGRDNKEQVRIVGRTHDKVVEAMEVGDHIMSFQHHNEAEWKSDKIAKSILNQYKKQVIKHCEDRQAPKFKANAI